jgi:hypothetical protein
MLAKQFYKRAGGFIKNIRFYAFAIIVKNIPEVGELL